jgi:hypothetical protein
MNTISLTPVADKLMTAALRSGGVTLGHKSGRRLLALDLCDLGLLRIEGHRHGVTTLSVTHKAVTVCSPTSVLPSCWLQLSLKDTANLADLHCHKVDGMNGTTTSIAHDFDRVDLDTWADKPGPCNPR